MSRLWYRVSNTDIRIEMCVMFCVCACVRACVRVCVRVCGACAEVSDSEDLSRGTLNFNQCNQAQYSLFFAKSSRFQEMLANSSK